LRARPQDIPALVQQLLPALCRKHHRPQLQLSPSAWQQLQDYAWPGNVRELQHVLERAVVLAEQTELHSSDLALQPSPPQPPSDLATPLAPMGLPPFDLQWHQQQLINAALQAAEGQQAEAARLLGISRFALARRLEKS
jgi:DNA-binding NtrC family response regulator